MINLQTAPHNPGAFAHVVSPGGGGISNGNRTEWSTIHGVIGRVI